MHAGLCAPGGGTCGTKGSLRKTVSMIATRKSVGSNIETDDTGDVSRGPKDSRRAAALSATFRAFLVAEIGNETATEKSLRTAEEIPVKSQIMRSQPQSGSMTRSSWCLEGGCVGSAASLRSLLHAESLCQRGRGSSALLQPLSYDGSTEGFAPEDIGGRQPGHPRPERSPRDFD